MNASSEHTLSPPLCDTLLRLAPLNILLFDTDLVCRYAAPVGDELLGQPRETLMGRPAADIWPPAANGLRPVLERAAHEAAPWQNREYRFTHRMRDAELPCCWSIQVEPVAVDGYRGVLVSWSDMLEAAQERDQVRAEAERLQRQEAQRREALVHLASDLLNLVTPISGYLQVIARRPEMLGRRAPAELIATYVLPRVEQLVATIDRLRHPPIAT